MSTCNCKTDIETKLTERFVQQTPKGRDHKVSLKGYAITIGAEVRMRPFMPYETFALMPLAKGGEKQKKTSGSMFFTYCPFCGAKVVPDAATQGDKP